jgi:ABC-type multidrug transport system ATPase subunit
MVGTASKAAEILLAMQLWEARNTLIADLSPSQTAACELIEPLSSGSDLVLIDGQLDRLDPWTLRSTLDLIGKLRSTGTAFVIATNRPDLMSAFDALIVLKGGQVRFAGTVDDLLRMGPRHTLHVATENRPGVQALIAPFEVSVKQSAEGVILEAAEGQALAARLLLEGYGDVKFVVVRPPTVEEALLSLFS